MIEVKRSDGVCRSCGGILHVIDADDATMVVECDEGGEGYTVEPDAFGDGGIEYWPAMMSELQGGEYRSDGPVLTMSAGLLSVRSATLAGRLPQPQPLCSRGTAPRFPQYLPR